MSSEPHAIQDRHSHRRRRWGREFRASLVVIASTLGVTVPLACDSAPSSANGGRAANGATADGPPRWPYWPTSMRVHPLSRVIRADAESPFGVLDLRLEASDADGIDGRAVGTITIELVARGRNAEPTRFEWTVDLADPAVNRRLFDTVTRTYHIRREFEWTASPAPGTMLQLNVTLDTADGRTLRSRSQLRWD